jgi:hypothetical protein
VHTLSQGVERHASFHRSRMGHLTWRFIFEKP